MTNELEILVVDDKSENRAGAKAYFDTRQDVRVDYATNYEDAERKIQEKPYAFGLFDVQMPRTDGKETEELGYKLAELAEKNTIDWATVTSGTTHGNIPGTFVKYCFTGLDTRGEGIGYEKTNQNLWKAVYEKLLGEHPSIRMLVRAKQRYFQVVGKNPIKLE